MQRAKDELGIEISELESASVSDYPDNLKLLAENGCDLVIGVGINMQLAVEEASAEFPDTNFAIIDAAIEQDNVRSILFTEEQGSYLVGYLAGLMTETNKIGFVGGQELDLIKKFQYGYFAGALHANPEVELLPAKYTGDWDNVDKGKVAANVLYSGGADIVYHAAGRAGLGVIRAAADNGKYAIGVDSDQDSEEPGSVLTSMIKGVDNAVFQTIDDVVNGSFSGGAVLYDLAAGGVGVSPMTHTKEDVGEENLAKLDEVKQAIIAGEIVVPKTENEFKASR